MLANVHHLADGKYWQLGFWMLLTVTSLLMVGRASVCVVAGHAVPRQRPRTKADRLYFALTSLVWLGLHMMAAVCFTDVLVTVKPVLHFVNLRNYGLGIALVGAGLVFLLRFEILAMYMVPFPGTFGNVAGRIWGVVAAIIGLGLLLAGVSSDGLQAASTEAAAIVQALESGPPVTP